MTYRQDRKMACKFKVKKRQIDSSLWRRASAFKEKWKAKDDECLHIEANKEELGQRSLINRGQGGRSVLSNHCDEQLNWVRGVCITR